MSFFRKNPPRNTELAHAVMDYITEHPERHKQTVWTSPNPFSSSCGTVACFAGWTCLLSGAEPLDWDGTHVRYQGETRLVSALAQELLGLTDKQAGTMFSPHNTREDLERQVSRYFK